MYGAILSLGLCALGYAAWRVIKPISATEAIVLVALVLLIGAALYVPVWGPL